MTEMPTSSVKSWSLSLCNIWREPNQMSSVLVALSWMRRDEHHMNHTFVYYSFVYVPDMLCESAYQYCRYKVNFCDRHFPPERVSRYLT